MNRTAQCHCGALTVKVSGDPELTFMCHCEFCQRRTGSSYHLDAWFPKTAATIEGQSSVYSRKGDRGDSLVFHFCPTCGSNVYFYLPEALPNMIGIAVGCFADPDFPTPKISIYEKRRHRWLEVPTDSQRHESGIVV